MATVVGRIVFNIDRRTADALAIHQRGAGRVNFLNFIIWYNHCDELWEVLHVGRTEAKTVLRVDNKHKTMRWLRRVIRKRRLRK